MLNWLSQTWRAAIFMKDSGRTLSFSRLFKIRYDADDPDRAVLRAIHRFDPGGAARVEL